MEIEYETWVSLQGGDTGLPNAEYETLEHIKNLACKHPCAVKITVNGPPEHCLKYDRNNEAFQLIPINK
jgi:hypothetical protein